ncbi:MAG TPA: hypothetical protein PK811_06665, partial [bacterium]|nr:hypothetical protein [bacterium]
RDTDSRLNPREADAVEEWIESGKSFHIMRDHPQHNVPICGGMWGADRYFIERYGPEHQKNLSKFFNSLHTSAPGRVFHQRGEYFNTDQPYLWTAVFPLLMSGEISSISHNKDKSLFRGVGDERLFRIKNRDNSFVGQPFDI